MRILIMTAAFGTGHNQVAAALAEAAEDAGHVACVVDGLAIGMPVIGSWMTRSFIQLLKTAPGLYRAVYAHSEEPGKFDTFKRGGVGSLARLMWSGVAPLCERFQPDAVLCTHPFVLGAMSHIRRLGKLAVPVAGVLTDFASHPFWIHPGVDEYFVATADMARTMCAQGVSSHQVYVTGIPVRRAFTLPCDRREAAWTLGLDPSRPTVLVMGGGLGLGPIQESVAAACRVALPLQVLVVAGQNEALFESLKPLAGQRRGGTTVHLYGYVPYVHTLMAASDLLVSKPGAVTAAEALALGVPMLLLNPVPGHEERNQAVLTTEGAAQVLSTVTDLPDTMARLIREPQKLATMRLAARHLGAPGAARAVIGHVAGLAPTKEMLLA